MDIARPDAKKKKRFRQIAYGVAALIAIVLITGALHTLKPAAPSVDKATLWPGTVQRGPMLREVRGLGTLVPETILLIPAQTDGQIAQRYLLPGTPVKKDTVIFAMSNPELQQAAMDAQYQVKGAEAELNNLKAQLQNQLMDQKAKAAVVRSAFHQAQIQRETNAELFKLGLTSDVILRTSQVAEEELGKQNDIAEKQVETFANSIDAQIAVQQAKVDQLHALAQLKQSQVEQLKMRPGIDGMLQELDVEVGQRVTAGTVLARVAPAHAFEGRAENRGNPGQGYSASGKKPRSTRTTESFRPRDAHRSRGAKRHRNRGRRLDGRCRRARARISAWKAPIEIERLADVLFVGPAGARRSRQHRRTVQSLPGNGGEAVARSSGAGAGLGEHGRGREGAANRRHGDSVRHVGMGQFRPHSIEVGAARQRIRPAISNDKFAKERTRMTAPQRSPDSARRRDESFLHRRSGDARAGRRASGNQERRIHVDRRAVGLRQVDAALDSRPARFADRRHSTGSTGNRSRIFRSPIARASAIAKSASSSRRST